MVESLRSIAISAPLPGSWVNHFDELDKKHDDPPGYRMKMKTELTAIVLLGTGALFASLSRSCRSLSPLGGEEIKRRAALF